MSTPTQLAQQKFREALMYLNQEAGADSELALVNNNLLQGLKSMNEGLLALSGGVRATYSLLEELKTTLDSRAMLAQMARNNAPSPFGPR